MSKKRTPIAVGPSDASDKEVSVSPVVVSDDVKQLDECPFGVPVRLISADGAEAIGVRSQYHPQWLCADRATTLSFVPATWAKA